MNAILTPNNGNFILVINPPLVNKEDILLQFEQQTLPQLQGIFGKPELKEGSYSFTFSKEGKFYVENFLIRNNIAYYDNTIPLEINNYEGKNAILRGNYTKEPLQTIFLNIVGDTPQIINRPTDKYTSGVLLTNEQALRLIARLRENAVSFTNNYKVFTPGIAVVYDEDKNTVEVDVNTLNRVVAILKILGEKYNSGDLNNLAKRLEKLTS
jgi:hypothetical protein